MNRSKRSAINIFTIMANNILKTIFPFVIRTLVIYRLGEQYSGLGSLFVSILSVLNISELGFGTAVTYFMYKPMADQNYKDTNALLTFMKKIFFVVGGIILVAGMMICPFVGKLIKGDIPKDINIYVLYLIYLLNSVISYFFGGYKKIVLTAGQRNDVDANINSFVYFVCSTIQIIVLLARPNYYMYIIWLPIGTLFTNLFLAYKADKLYPDVYAQGDVSKEQKNGIIQKVKALFFNKIGTIILTSSDNIVISISLGLTTVAYYGNYYQIVYSIITVTYMSFGAITSVVANKIVKDCTEDNRTLFFSINFWVCMISGIFFAGFFNLLQELMTLWMGINRLLNFSTVVCLCIFFYVWQFRRASITFYDALGLWDKSTYRPLISAAVNLFSNILLVNLIGINGVIISTILSMAIVEAPWEIYVIFKYYFKESPTEYIKKNMYYVFTVILMTVVGTFICHIIPLTGLTGFIIKSIVIGFSSVGIILLFWCRTDCFKYGLQLIKNIFLHNSCSDRN